MNRATSRISTPTLSHASHALAEFFAGIVLVEEEDGSLQPVARSSETTQPKSSILADLLEADELALTELDFSIDPTRSDCPDQQPPQDSQVLVSLAQLRQWYALARSQGQHDRLARIQALGMLFKQAFGAADPEVPKPFLGWSAEEIQWWLEDLNDNPVESSQPETCFSSPVHSVR